MPSRRTECEEGKLIGNGGRLASANAGYRSDQLLLLLLVIERSTDRSREGADGVITALLTPLWLSPFRLNPGTNEAAGGGEGKKEAVVGEFSGVGRDPRSRLL